MLGTRTNFSRKFASLLKIAEEGKGLPEVVYLDEHRKSPDLSSVEGDGFADGPVIRTQDFKETDDLTYDFQGKVQGSSVVQGFRSPPAQKIEPSEANIPLGLENFGDDGSYESSSGVHEAEEDLIDYSEEEYEETYVKAESKTSTLPTDGSDARNGTYTDFIPPCLQPNACFCSKCTGLIVAEEQAKDEELHRRSLSRAVKDTTPEQELKKATGPDKNDPSDIATSAKDDLAYDEDLGHEEVDPVPLITGHDTPPTNNSKVDHTEAQTQKHDEEAALKGEDGFNHHENDDDYLEATLLASKPRNDFETDNGEAEDTNADRVFDDGLEFGEDDFTAFEDQQGLPDSDYVNDASSGDLYKLSKGSTEIDPKEPDAESDTVESDKTLEAFPASEIEQEDEIDYDDEDEEQDILKVQSLPVDSTKESTSQPGLGKRPRTEETTDKIMSTSSKGLDPLHPPKRWTYSPVSEAKRPRS